MTHESTYIFISINIAAGVIIVVIPPDILSLDKQRN